MEFKVRKARVVEVTDGDTVLALVESEFGIHIELPIRILGINAPEKHEAGYREAKEFIAGRISESLSIVTLEMLKKDTFKRWLCNIILKDGSSLGTLMLENRLAVPYSKKKN